jgi:hypothetical protein
MPAWAAFFVGDCSVFVCCQRSAKLDGESNVLYLPYASHFNTTLKLLLNPLKGKSTSL